MAEDEPRRRDIPIRDLPQDLVAEFHRKIRLHSVTMVLPMSDGADPFCCSGTLVEINGMVGVLTARHVWTGTLKAARTVGLLVGSHEPYWIKPDVLRAFGPRENGVLPDTSAHIPDLAFVRIPPVARGTIEGAKKVFYRSVGQSGVGWLPLCATGQRGAAQLSAQLGSAMDAGDGLKRIFTEELTVQDCQAAGRTIVQREEASRTRDGFD